MGKILEEILHVVVVAVMGVFTLMSLEMSSTAAALICSRYPAHTFTPKSPVDENFVLSIQGNPQTYILGQEYNISLNAFNGLRYISFSLVVENEEGGTTYHQDLGHFEVTDTVETRYSPNCVNMIESTNTNPKNRVDVTWIAPQQPGSGCILIRATVLQHRDVWFMDDGGLTKKICEEVVDDVESKNIEQMIKPCCACDEARYELIFEGIWSRNLHPKDFPTKGWTARFSDLIGAAHSAEYRFWEYGSLASPAMQEFGEHGSSASLEKEFNLNFRNGQIRTIIKARGPAFPNLNGKSMASVRVDPQHHLISLASKITPSPDWIVGISGLELCHTNCTWMESKVINLYPWDLGTDAGPSYTSPNQPQVPADVIRRMRPDFPNDPRSPFFDETGAQMKPLASLTIRRQRLYERACADEDSNNNGIARECYTHPWTEWTECTSRCGPGKQYRSRVYKQPEIAKLYQCDSQVHLREDRDCLGSICGPGSLANSYALPELDLEQNYNRFPATSAECELSEWGPWSACNATCGLGKMMRTRQYLNPYNEEKCQSALFVQLMELRSCSGQQCLGEISRPSGFNNYNNYNNLEDQETKANEDLYTRSRFRNMPSSYTFNEDTSLYGPSGDINRIQSEGFNEMQVENLETVDSNPTMQRNFYSRSKANYRNPGFSEQERTQVYGKYPGNELSYGQAKEDPMIYEREDPIHSIRKHLQQRPDNNGNEAPVPSYCYEPLQIFTCLDTTVVGNFWFYNFCADECMIYAADQCDQNSNKFSSLEMCEMRCKAATSPYRLQQLQREQCPNASDGGGARQRLQGSLRSSRRKWTY